MKRRDAAAYCRVDRGSTLEETQNILAAQMETLERYAAAHELQIVGYYQDTAPGYDLSRPGLNQMITDYQSGQFDAVLVVKYTRLFRGGVWSEPLWPFPIISVNQLDRMHEQEKER